MYFEQVLRPDIGCAAYLVGSNEAGEVAAVDPRIDMVDELIGMAKRERLRIRYVIETHNHADHVSGHHVLARRTGATIAIHEAAEVTYPHLALHDGDELALGEVRLRILHTPGHRPEHIAVAAIDTTRGEEPWLVLTGDSLLIGDVARPDLAVPGQQGAEALFASMHEKLLALPDGTLAYPAHVSGSLCGRVTNRMTGTTVGFERRYNPALQIGDQPHFVRYMTESLPERPPNMGRIVALNMADEAAGTGETSTPAALSPQEVQRLRAGGALVLDTRSAADFGAGHIPGAIAVQLNGSQFPNRVGLVVPAEADLVLVSNKEAEVPRVLAALAVIGYNRIAGHLAGGMQAWRGAGYSVTTLAQIGVHDLHERLAADAPPRIVDVRERNEWEAGHIAGAIHIPFPHVAEHAAELWDGGPVALICASGQRSTIAASLLEAADVPEILNVVGGMGAWEAASLPTVH